MSPVRGAAAVGIAVGLLLIGSFAVTALTLHADAPHVVGNAAASALLVGAASHQLGPGVGLWLILLAGTGGNALTAVAYRTHHDSVGASTALFGAIGILAATRIMSRGRHRAARKRWMIVAASLALLALLGTSPDADLLAHLFGLLVGGGLGLAAAPALRWPLRPPTQWALAVAVLVFVIGAWLCAVS